MLVIYISTGSQGPGFYLMPEGKLIRVENQLGFAIDDQGRPTEPITTREQMKRRFSLWQCGNGTYDITDNCAEHADRIAYTNLGKPNDPESAWEALFEKLKRE